MQNVTDQLPPAPASPLPPESRLLNIGGVHYLVNARHGGFLANQNDFFLGNALIRYGEYGENEWHLLRQIIGQGAVVVEVGANIGTHTVPLAKAVGNHGRVIAIEPQRIIHQYLCANVSLNMLANVETHHAGCGANNGTMAVPPVDYYNKPQSNFGSVALVQQGQGEPVAIRTVDDIVGTRTVHLLKVDVEGMEIDVLRGAKKTLRKCRPLIYVENDRQDKSESLLKLIQDYDYRAYWHLPLLFNPMNYFGNTENIYLNMLSVNLLCVPKESTMNMANFTEATDLKYHPLRR